LSGDHGLKAMVRANTHRTIMAKTKVHGYLLTTAFKPWLEHRPKERTLVLMFFFAFFKIIPTFAVTNQIFLPFQGVWFLLRRAERLGSAKPWQPIPIFSGERCQNLIPESREMIKINTRTMKTFHSIHENQILPYLPMGMGW